MTFSMEQMLIDNDFMSMILKSMEGIEVSEKTLGVESIQKVGIGNNFLSHKTTMQNVDLPSDPLLINRDMIGDWTKAGSKDLASAAHDMVLQIMKTHEVAPIDADLVKDMQKVVDRGDKAFFGKE